jgi:hypothetical protein
MPDTAVRPNAARLSGSHLADWRRWWMGTLECGVVDCAGRDAESERLKGCDQRAREEEVLDAYAVETDASPPGCKRMYAVVGDDDESRPKAELGGQLACTGPEADYLGPLPRRVVAKALAESSGSVACEGRVGVCLDLELERRAGRRELEQVVEQQRALVAWSAVRVAEPARADLRRGALVGPAGHRGADFEQRVVQQHEFAGSIAITVGDAGAAGRYASATVR